MCTGYLESNDDNDYIRRVLKRWGRSGRGLPPGRKNPQSGQLVSWRKFVEGTPRLCHQRYR
jgi:hypothetical protein